MNIIFYIYINNNDSKKNENNIHLCMSLNEKYIYQLLVSIESILINCDKSRSFLTFHILCNPDIKEISLLKIKSLTL